MATLDSRISSLTGIDTSGATIQTYIQDWIQDSIREVYSSIPRTEKFRYATQTAVAFSYAGEAISEPILGVIFSTDATFVNVDKIFECREINHIDAFEAAKSSSVKYATTSDPVYYIQPATVGLNGPSSAQTVKALPTHLEHINDTPTYIKISYLNMNALNYDPDSESSPVAIPNEVDHLIVLCASIKAATYLLQNEQDEDIYVPLLTSLKQDYQLSLQLYLSQFGAAFKQSKEGGIKRTSQAKTAEQLRELIDKYSEG